MSSCRFKTHGLLRTDYVVLNDYITDLRAKFVDDIIVQQHSNSKRLDSNLFLSFEFDPCSESRCIVFAWDPLITRCEWRRPYVVYVKIRCHRKKWSHWSSEQAITDQDVKSFDTNFRFARIIPTKMKVVRFMSDFTKRFLERFLSHLLLTSDHDSIETRTRSCRRDAIWSTRPTCVFVSSRSHDYRYDILAQKFHAARLSLRDFRDNLKFYCIWLRHDHNRAWLILVRISFVSTYHRALRYIQIRVIIELAYSFVPWLLARTSACRQRPSSRWAGIIIMSSNLSSMSFLSFLHGTDHTDGTISCVYVSFFLHTVLLIPFPSL